MSDICGFERGHYNIAIDVQPMYSGHCYRGIGNYVRGMLKALFRLDRDNTYYLVNYYGEIPAKLKLRGGDNVFEIDRHEETTEKHLYDKATKASREYFRRSTQEIIDKYNIDIYMICAGIDQFDVYDKECFKNVKLINFAYDLIPLVFKKEYLSGEYAYIYAERLQSYIFSDYTFTDSKSAMDDLIQMVGIEEKRVSPVYSGIPAIFEKKEYEKEEVSIVKGKFGITTDYLLCVGADDFRKNLDRLVNAFVDMPEKLIKTHQLVITCAMTQQSTNRLLSYAHKRGYDGRVVITNYVSDEDLLCLLNHAKLAVFPSMYEGFGLPVVEAWKCGVPVLTSNNSSLGEIAKDAAILVDPDSCDSIRDGLIHALTEADLKELAEIGETESKKYTWDNVAGIIVNSYAKIIGMEKVNADSAESREKMRRARRQCLKKVKLTTKLHHSFKG